MKRHRAWGVALIVLAVLAVPWAGLWGPSGIPTVAAAPTVDQEIVYLDSTGRIKVHDPYVPPGKEAVVWQSPDSGWSAVATGDFNGDGDDEIIALRGATAKVFDPVVQKGQAKVVFNRSASPNVWELVATGDIDADGRDEIVLTHSDNAGGIREHLTVWDGGADGTSWTKVRDNGYGWPWDAIALGDVNADGRDDIGMIRYWESLHDRRLTILNPVTWSALHDKSYDFPWLDIAIGDTDAVSNLKDEIVLTRQDVIAALNSYLVMRWKSGSSSLDTVHGEKFYPYFTDIALGDVNNSGDDEVFLLRDPRTDDGVSFIMRNYGTDAVPSFEVRIGRNWKAVVAGDVDGDSRAEAVILSSTQIRIYQSPDVDTSYTNIAGSYRTFGRNPIALGNLDGEGIVAEPQLGVTPTSLSLQLQSGDKTNRFVDVTNVGAGGSFAWSATVTAGSKWLTISPSSGTTPATITLLIDTTGMPPGTYEGRVQVTAAGISGSPKEVVVNLTLTAPPFDVQPDKIVLTVMTGRTYPLPRILITGSGIDWVAGVIPAGSWVTLSDALDRSGKLEITEDGVRVEGESGVVTVPTVPWVNLEPSEGTAPSAIYVTVDETKMTPGLNRATIVIDGGPTVSPRLHGVDLVVVFAQRQVFLPAVDGSH
ncbi:MAG: VCBS repeat-containing protein [Chloroflexi bacterium]|nr:VCBS repeat-containing protein [Chloroflexota bacterium]